MTRKRNAPCSECGELMFAGRGSLPPDQRRCLPCRRKVAVRVRVGGEKRVWLQKARVCRDCETGFQGTVRTHYCWPCILARHAREPVADGLLVAVAAVELADQTDTPVGRQLR